MAETVQFDLVSPERLLTSVQAREVQIPGAEGDLTAMADHAPLITTLRPGIVRVLSDKGEDEYAVTGGFAEINNDSVSLLAERGHPRAEMTQEIFNDMMGQAQRRVQQIQERSTGEDIVTAAVKLLADMEAMGTHIGLDPNQSNFPH